VADDETREATMTMRSRLELKTRRIMMLGALLLGGLALVAEPACERDLLGAACPCVAGWVCCSADNTCHPSATGCPGGDAGPSPTDDAGAAMCSAPNGHAIPYTTVAELEAMIEGDWLRCSGTAYPAEFGVGLRIAPDHTWNALDASAGGGVAPITTGFDGYGTWTAAEIYAGAIQFNLLKLDGGGAGYRVAFTDSGQMQMDPGGVHADYQRLPASPPPAH
jgi:hypothetical protein